MTAEGLLYVASFTDAWIETSTIAVLTVVTVSHLLQMRGLKLIRLIHFYYARKSHLLQMRGLKLLTLRLYGSFLSRIFYRCVD